MQTNGKYVVSALEHIGEPTTVAALVDFIAAQTNSPAIEVDQPVRQVLRKGLAYGFVERLQSKYYLTSNGGGLGGATDRKERQTHRANMLLPKRQSQTRSQTAVIKKGHVYPEDVSLAAADAKNLSVEVASKRTTNRRLGQRLERLRRVFTPKMPADNPDNATVAVATARNTHRNFEGENNSRIEAESSLRLRSRMQTRNIVRVAGVPVERPPKQKRRRHKLLNSALAVNIEDVGTANNVTHRNRNPN